MEHIPSKPWQNNERDRQKTKVKGEAPGPGNLTRAISKEIGPDDSYDPKTHRVRSTRNRGMMEL
jgi:hypothetical protein